MSVPGPSIAPAALTPLTTGEVLDRAFTVLRRQFRPLFQIALVLQLFSFGVAKLYQRVGDARFPLLMKPVFFQKDAPSPERVAGQLGWALGAVGVLVAAGVVLWQVGVAALSARPGEDPLSAPVVPRVAFARLLAQLPALLATLVLELGVLGLAVAVGALPGAVAVLVGIKLAGTRGLVLAGLGALGGLFLALAAWLLALLQLALTPQVVMVEGLRYFRALGRSAHLMRGRAGQRFWERPTVRGSILMLVSALVTNSLMLVATLPRLLLMYGQVGPGSGLAGYGALPMDLVEILAEAAVSPFGLLVMVLFYVDLRVRREGMDLALAAERLVQAP